ncbi:hypothetical protein [Bacillus sp. V2I10]|uniref:hypothetical protein n=1 Tax=Bacillus sp. V2I10 TaxID=3042276 RepID=UPI002786FD42|nr:hypothetical protein [Bacillus sp. V2I10]MDQ0859810.1 hypothetical protein [Bacillus sp. V2I10]
MKRMSFLFFILLGVVIAPLSSAFANESKEEVTVDIVPINELKASGEITAMAGNGGWDDVGYSAILQYSSNTGFDNITDYKYSTGGDFMFCINNSAWDKNQRIGYQLFEYDPNSLTSVGGVIDVKEGYCAIYRDINSRVDGSNKKAEFAVGRENRKSENYNHVYVNIDFYD